MSALLIRRPTFYKPRFFTDAKFAEIARKYNKSVVQVVIRYMVCNTNLVPFFSHPANRISHFWPSCEFSSIPFSLKSVQSPYRSRSQRAASMRTLMFSISPWPLTKSPTLIHSIRANALCLTQKLGTTFIFRLPLNTEWGVSITRYSSIDLRPEWYQLSGCGE